MPFENLSDHFIIHMYESIRDEVLAHESQALACSANRRGIAPNSSDKK